MVSVIVPVYNVAETLEQCIQSLCAQTYSCFELLLIDDASTDCSAEICRLAAQRDGRIRPFYCDKNQGPSHARNVGLNHAHGLWISFVDSDDTVAPDFLEVLLKEGGAKTMPMTAIGTEEKNGQTQTFARKDFLKLYQKDGSFHSCTNKLYQADIVKEHQIRFPQDCRNGEDLLFNLEYLHWIDWIIYRPQTVYYYAVKESKDKTALHTDATVERFYSIQRMDQALSHAAREFGAGADQWIADQKMLREYLYTIMLYTQNTFVSWEQKVAVLRDFLTRRRTEELFDQLDKISVSKYYKAVLRSRSASLICLYGILCGKRKRRKKA